MPENYRCLVCLEMGGIKPGAHHKPSCAFYKKGEAKSQASPDLWAKFSKLFKQGGPNV